jgi:hypothetical protein
MGCLSESNTANGVLKVSGAATLGSGGTLLVSLLGGFNPAIGTSFTILDYGSESGTFQIADPTFNNGTERWVITSYDGGGGDDIVLTAEKNMTPTPEPPSALLLATGIALAGIFTKYRNAAKRILHEVPECSEENSDSRTVVGKVPFTREVKLLFPRRRHLYVNRPAIGPRRLRPRTWSVKVMTSLVSLLPLAANTVAAQQSSTALQKASVLFLVWDKAACILHWL